VDTVDNPQQPPYMDEDPAPHPKLEAGLPAQAESKLWVPF
jgi:hypothetical protein